MRTLLLVLVALTIGVVGIAAEPAAAAVTINVCANASAGGNVGGTPVGPVGHSECLTTGI